ncbi:MAG: hypothetical protein ACI4T6_01190 [Candidatus Flemingiibacterium sp.]
MRGENMDGSSGSQRTDVVFICCRSFDPASLRLKIGCGLTVSC